jgi:hypothetical protein
VYERNKENRKRKEKREIKIELDPGGNVSAQYRNKPAAHLALSRSGTLFPLSLAARWTPPVGFVFSPNFSPLPLSYWKRR